MSQVAIIDYGMGNLRSIVKALEEVGARVTVTDRPQDIASADRIVLPGVGAFGDGMRNLQSRGLDAVLTEQVQGQRKPFLGICLGMQLAALTSEEFGTHDGLAWIDATVRRFDFSRVQTAQEEKLRVPHVGWNTVLFLRDHPLRAEIANEAEYYFVHSFHLFSASQDDVLGTCHYGYQFPAVVVRGNIALTQFHPEKSQRDGMQMLLNFIHWNP